MKQASWIFWLFYLIFEPFGQYLQGSPKGDFLVFETSVGPLVFRLFEDQVPLHSAQFKNFVAVSGYDHTPVWRVLDGYLIQFADAENNRLRPLTAEQRQALKPLPLETSQELSHLQGRLSIIRDKSPGAAVTSFAILLTNSPHWDGIHTVVGEVVGARSIETLKLMVEAPRKGDKPREDIVITKAFIEQDPSAIASYNTDFSGPQLFANAWVPPPPQKVYHGPSLEDEGRDFLLLWILLLSILPFFGYLLYPSLSKEQVLDLAAAVGLGAALLALMLSYPRAFQYRWLLASCSLGLMAMTQFLRYFGKEA